MSAAWAATGWTAPGAFRDARRCGFRLCHQHQAGPRFVTTLGDYRTSGKLEPVMPGFTFVSFVTEGENEPRELDRAGANDWRTAEAQHCALLERFAHWETETP